MTIDTRTEADYYHDVATTVGDVTVKIAARKVEYRREVVIKKGGVWSVMSTLDRLLTDLPTTYVKCDNAVLWDAKIVSAALKSETARRQQEAILR